MVHSNSKWYQYTLIVITFLLSGLAYLFYHYIYMPELSDIWTYYGFLIMVLPVWLVYGIHELTLYLTSKLLGVRYYYTCSYKYELFVTLMLVYGSFSLLYYKITKVDIRLLLPVIFLPALSVKISEYRNSTQVAECFLSSLLVTFFVTMVFVLWIESCGGIHYIQTLTGSVRKMYDTLYTISLYGLFVCISESLPLKIGELKFDGYEIFRSKNYIFILLDVLVLVISLYFLMFRGYLQYFILPLGGGSR